MSTIYTIAVTGHEARITPKLPDIIAERLSNALSFEPVGAEWSPTHKSQKWRTVDGKRTFNKKAQWDGKVRLFKKGRGAYNHFPSGLLQRALDCLTPVLKDTVRVETPARVVPTAHTLDGRVVPLKGEDITIEVRPYQCEVVEALLTAPWGRAMAESPTGSGKSIIIGELCIKFPASQICVTVPSKSLLHQTAADLEALLGEKIGRLGDGKKDLRRVTVAIVNSMRSGLKKPEVVEWLGRQEVWITDESHLAATDDYLAVSEFMPGALWRMGVTATNRREDGKDMVIHGTVGPERIKISPQRLIDEGWLVPPRIEFHVLDHDYQHDREATGRKKPTFDEVYQAEIVQSVDRNNAVLEQAYRCMVEDRLPCLILVRDLEHGALLQDYIAQLGPTAWLHGADEQEVRADVIALLKKRELPYVVASSIFDIGIDIPPLRSIIIAGSGKSASRTIQRAGRGLRPSPATGKTDVLIIDFEDREAHFLHDHSMERKWWTNLYYPGYVTTWKNGKVLKELTIGKKF